MWPDRRIIDLFKTEFPILLAPMAGIMDQDLAIAVAQGGGLASIPCAMITADKAREQVGILRQRVSAPVNLNFFCHTPVAADPAREAGWKARLGSYYGEFGLDPAAPVNAANRAPFDEAACALVEELKPEVVSFHFGLPDAALVKRVKAAGAIVMASATIVKEAIWLEQHGADVIIAQGAEAGGHRGMFLTENIYEQPGTFALVPQVVDAVKVPVIAAGGIADGRGIAAAFALGASGVQIGSAYLRCPESKVSRAGPRAVRAVGRRFHRHYQCHDRPARARRRQPPDARGRPDLAGCAGVPARGDRARPAEGRRRKARQGRFHQCLGGAGDRDGHRHAGGRTDPRAGGERVGAAERARRLAFASRRTPMRSYLHLCSMVSAGRRRHPVDRGVE